ncbi:MAG TPA: glycerol-3-phosphate dehydrogenase/oxidase, partial [Candidatus Binataceae bacterium]|nr:glycerol-3-phosphate dehydrogenase/oxidase [Candidatus Binataceae bacterium]
TISAGLTLYDLMALTRRSERHKRLRSSRVHEIEPGLRSDTLLGGVIYYDGWGDDARVTLENVLDAAYHGAVVANYSAVEDFEHTASSHAVAVRDVETDAMLTVRARHVVNAAGPWVDQIRRMDESGCTARIRLTKGVHLVFESDRLPVRHALVLTDHEGRIIFIMPHGRYVLVGTTDTDFDGDCEKVAADATDIDYLLTIVNDCFPELALRAADVAACFAGLRSLPQAASHARPSSVPREEVILHSQSGLISVAGGKLTTHRRIAEEVVDLLCDRQGFVGRKFPTRTVPLPGARVLLEDCLPPATLPNNVGHLLHGRYGNRTQIIAALAANHAELAKPLVDGCSTIRAEVIFATRYEMARSVADFLVRRTSMTWQAPREARAAVPIVGRLMARELGWEPVRELLEINRFKELEKSILGIRP